MTITSDFYSVQSSVRVGENEYPVNPRFDHWIKICRLISASDIPSVIKSDIIIRLVSERLYSDLKSGIVPLTDCIRAISRYMNPFYREDRAHDSSSKPMTDIIIDSDLIFSSFMAVYHINLSNTDISWRHFIVLLRCLPQDCAFCDTVRLRCADESHIKDDRQRHRIRHLKRLNSLENKKRNGDDSNG